MGARRRCETVGKAADEDTPDSGIVNEFVASMEISRENMEARKPGLPVTAPANDVLMR